MAGVVPVVSRRTRKAREYATSTLPVNAEQAAAAAAGA
jgi:hypothetical protein